MKCYDEAANKFYRSLKITSLPLLSWDLYGPYFAKVCSNFEDIVSLGRLAVKNKWAHCPCFDDALLEKEQVIVVTDECLRIVHATDNIFSLNGYDPREILGKRPKLFQGPQTCAKTTRRIRTAVKNKMAFEETVINYRKNGSTYKCWIKGEPIFDTDGRLVNFIAYEKEVA